MDVIWRFRRLTHEAERLERERASNVPASEERNGKHVGRAKAVSTRIEDRNMPRTAESPTSGRTPQRAITGFAVTAFFRRSLR